ncbi:ATP-binding protein [Kitasatospora sp. NPDC007106]|uniref:ATP-binding protein n=1 Tax=Kitasatospora sp. NPDC007106 TaxID=3156914 RepID=UPI003402B666
MADMTSTRSTEAVTRSGQASAIGEKAVCTLAASAEAAPKFRSFVRAAGTRWNLPGEAEDALMVIASELATNSYLHSGSADVWLMLRNGPEFIEIEVADQGSWKRSGCGSRSRFATHGRGLGIIDAYAASVSIQRGLAGTRTVARVTK